MRFWLKLLNKKGEEDIVESILDIPRIVFLIFVLIALTTPIGCYSQNKQAQLDKVNNYETNLLFVEAKNCLEKGISENIFKECFRRENIGLRITSPSYSFAVNPEKFEQELCPLSKNIKCREGSVIIKDNEKIRKILIEMVVRYE